MSIDLLLAFYVFLLLGAVALLALLNELRQRRFGPAASPDRIFKCGQCNFVYTDDPDVDRSRCSQCGILNEAIKF
jgi:hypothetical protein